MTKKELRAAMRRRNLGMDAAERAEASRRIFGRAGRLEAFGAARTVGVFCSLPDEPDTAETLARWSAVKRIVVPRVEGDVMRFCEYDPQTLRPGAFGIAEPGPESTISFLSSNSDINLFQTASLAICKLLQLNIRQKN